MGQHEGLNGHELDLTGGERPFDGFSLPNYTQVPDELFDRLLPLLSGAELKVLLYIMRKTFGWKKESDNISLNQICRGITTRDGRVLDRGTGLSQSTALVALKGLTAKRAIIAVRRMSKEKGHEPTTYSLNLKAGFPENRGRGGPKIGEGPSSKIGRGLPRKSGTQQTPKQETLTHTQGVGSEASKTGEGDGPASVVEYFHQRAGHSQAVEPTGKELEQAGAILAEHGEEKARWIVDFALEKAGETNFRVRHFGALLAYVSEALNAFQSGLENRRRAEELRRKLEAEERDREADRAAWEALTPEQRVERRVQTAAMMFQSIKGRSFTEEELEERRRRYEADEGIGRPSDHDHHAEP